MRDIKLKAYWYKTKLTTLVDTIAFVNGGTHVSDGCTDMGWVGKDCDVMQYIGLKDNNGKEIFEGDIIQDEYGKRYLIKWGVNSNGFIAKTNENHSNVYSSYHLAPKTIVIGNIYENPELLEVI